MGLTTNAALLLAVFSLDALAQENHPIGKYLKTYLEEKARHTEPEIASGSVQGLVFFATRGEFVAVASTRSQWKSEPGPCTALFFTVDWFDRGDGTKLVDVWIRDPLSELIEQENAYAYALGPQFEERPLLGVAEGAPFFLELACTRDGKLSWRSMHHAFTVPGFELQVPGGSASAR